MWSTPQGVIPDDGNCQAHAQLSVLSYRKHEERIHGELGRQLKTRAQTFASDEKTKANQVSTTRGMSTLGDEGTTSISIASHGMLFRPSTTFLHLLRLFLAISLLGEAEKLSSTGGAIRSPILKSAPGALFSTQSPECTPAPQAGASYISVETLLSQDLARTMLRQLYYSSSLKKNA